jgi:cupin superfamily acireductone dioxygenase involved in methionine salvage
MKFFVRTIMEIEVEADSVSQAKSKAIESFKNLNGWVPIFPLATIRDEFKQLDQIHRNLLEMENILK